MTILDTIRGLSDSKFSGILGSVYRCVGLDIHSEPGLVKVHQKLTKNSGSTVDALCRARVSVSTGDSLWFSYTSGKIWSRTTAGTWTLVYTTVATGDDFCVGAAEYNGYVYWATTSRLHRIAVGAAIDTAAYWTTNAAVDWATFAVTDSSWHPMVVQDITLWIGDANRLCSVNSAGTFNNNALDLKTPYRIKCLIDYDEDILIGTFVATTVNKTEVIRWDLVSSSWNTSDPIEEVGINAFIRDDNYVYAQAGRAGNIYFYNGSQLEPFKRIPGDYSNVKYGEVYSESVGNFQGRPIFGFSNSSESGNSTGNPALQGIYTLGSYSRDYPKVMDLSWVISQDKTATIEIGGILVEDFNLLVAWKDGSNYGVDAIDYSNKYASAYLETMMLFQDKRDISKTLREVKCYYNSLPASTSITFSYDVNGAGYVAMTSVTNSKINEIRSDKGSVDSVGSLMIKVAFGVSGNNAPTLEIVLAVDIDGIE